MLNIIDVGNTKLLSWEKLKLNLFSFIFRISNDYTT